MHGTGSRVLRAVQYVDVILIYLLAHGAKTLLCLGLEYISLVSFICLLTIQIQQIKSSEKVEFLYSMKSMSQRST